MQQPKRPTTIAILGADTVVGSALSALLEGYGYRTSPIDAYPRGVADELLEGADLLLLAPRLEEGAREAFVGAIGKSAPQRGAMPVISLSTTPTEESFSEGRVLNVPWPCTTDDLVGHIEAALVASASSNCPR